MTEKVTEIPQVKWFKFLVFSMYPIFLTWSHKKNQLGLNLNFRIVSSSARKPVVQSKMDFKGPTFNPNGFFLLRQC